MGGDNKYINKKHMIKGAVWVGLLIVITCAIELFVFNFQPFFHPSETVSLRMKRAADSDEIITYEGISKDVQKELSEDTRRYRLDELEEMEEILNARENYRATCFELKNPAYYKKLKLRFKTKKNVKYYLDVNYINEYGEKETYYTSDKAFKILQYGVTNINKKVSSITVYLPQDVRIRIKSMELSNQIQWNKYRMMCVFTCLVVLSMLFLTHTFFAKRLELLVLIWGFLFGICFLMSQGINENSWDEHVHFMSIYQLASGDSYKNTETIKRMQNRVQKEFYSTNEEKYAVTKYINKKYKDDVNADVVESRRPIYKDILYIPQVMMTKAAISFGWSFEQLCIWTKGISLIIYIIALAFIVWKANVYKLLFTVIGLMPINVFVAASFSYNPLTLIFHMAGFMLWLNIVYNDKALIGIKEIGLIFLCFALGSCSKPMYILMALLILIIPAEKYKNPHVKKRIWIAIAIVVIAVFIVLGIPMIKTLLKVGLYLEIPEVEIQI